MKITQALVCLTWFLGGSGVYGQQPMVTVSLGFTEVVAGTNTPVPNPNGVLEPGEAALIEMSIAFTPPVGSFIQTPAVQGTVAGLGTILYDLIGTNGAGGSWTHLGVAAGWLGWPGEVDIGGAAVRNLSVLQRPAPGTMANSQNPVDSIWRGVWTPSSYAARTVIFQTDVTTPPPFGGISHLLLQIDPVPTYNLLLNVFTQHGAVHIPIVPAPGTLGVMLLMLAACGQRRRQ
jgi:hypothetical protein